MNKKTLISSGVLVAVIIVVFGVAVSLRTTSTDTSSVAVDTTSNTTTEQPVASTPVTTPVTTPVPPTPATPVTHTTHSSTYKDGTYTVTGSYDSPAGMESIKVAVTLTNDIVTSATVTPLAEDRESAHYQKLFINGYSSLVVGKNISTVKLGRVSGSSLTPVGFNSALAQIEAQAKS